MLRLFVEFVVATGFGLGSSILPVFNNEAFIVAARGIGSSEVIPAVLGLALGNGVGKVLLLMGLRTGRRLPWRRTSRPQRRLDATRHPRLAAALAWRRRMLGSLLERFAEPGWGVPIMLLSAVTGVPPLYALTVVAAASRMTRWTFGICCTLGSLIRFAVIGLAVTGVWHLGD